MSNLLLKKNKNILIKRGIILDRAEFINVINIGLGYYAPLNRFCTFSDYKSIIKNKKIDKTSSWTIPILLNSKTKSNFLKKKEYYYLFYKNKKIGIIKSESIFRINKKKYCLSIFNTNSKKHPSVKKIYNSINSYIGGKVKLFNSSIPKDKFFIFNQIRINRKKIANSVVFSTRNICHLGHQFIHQKILKSNKKLTICIIESDKNKFDTNLVIKSYIELKKNYKLYNNINIIKIFLPSLFAGPNEAFLQAVFFNNNSFKKFIVGRDHAGFKNFYNKYLAQKIFSKKFALKIKIIKTKEPLMCLRCNDISFENKKLCKCYVNKKDLIKINGGEIKNNLVKNKFDLIKKYLNPIIFKFYKKNLNDIKNFKG